MFYDVADEMLSRDSDFFVERIMWQNFENSSISMREVIKTSIL